MTKLGEGQLGDRNILPLRNVRDLGELTMDVCVFSSSFYSRDVAFFI